ncbi:MAG: DUF1127 domain-containing protein [Rhodospirillales bacterium]|nr:DUF1127 domain-containing protein [Rhodospirillales bacterium]
MLIYSCLDSVPSRRLGSSAAGGRRARFRRWFAAAADTARLWAMRSRTRKHLADLTDHQLADIGLRRSEAMHERTKSFWQA